MRTHFPSEGATAGQIFPLTLKIMQSKGDGDFKEKQIVYLDPSRSTSLWAWLDCRAFRALIRALPRRVSVLQDWLTTYMSTKLLRHRGPYLSSHLTAGPESAGE